LPLLDAYFLNDQVQNEKYLKQCEKSRELIQEAQTYNLLVNRQNQIQNQRTSSRCAFHYLDALIIIGGEDDQVVLRSADAYFPLIDRWLPLRCSPFALSKHGVVSAGSICYMAGGSTPDANPNDLFWQYNSVLDEWSDLANMQNPRSELG